MPKKKDGAFGKLRDPQKSSRKPPMVQQATCIGKTRKFDPKLHAKWDIPARDIIINRFPKNSKENPDPYGEDMLFYHPDIPYKYIEVQVCATWDTEFPYNMPFVYERKMKFSKRTLFVTFSKDFSQLIMFAKPFIEKTPSRLQKYDRELVHLVPWNRARLMDTENFTIQNIKRYAGVDSDSDSEDEDDDSSTD